MKRFPVSICLVLMANLLLSLPIAAVFATDQAVTVKASLDKTEGTIGTRFSYVLQLSYPAGWEIVSDLTLPAPEMVEIEEKPEVTASDSDRQSLRKSFDVIPFTVGPVVFPSWEIRFQDPARASLPQVVMTSPLSLTIIPTRQANDSEEIRPIKGIVDIRRQVAELLSKFRRELTASAVTGFLLLLIMAFLIWKKKTAQGRARRSPFEQAIFEIESLKKSPALIQGDAKAFSEALSGLMRRYASFLLKEDALDLTTRELHERLREVRVVTDEAERLVKLLAECDLIKFAKFNPEKARLESLLGQGREILEALHRGSVPPDASSENGAS